MNPGLAALYGVGMIVAGGFVFCALMWFWCTAAHLLRHDGPGCDCADCDDMRQHMRDRPDCAESCCWELRLDEMVDQFDWEAAEYDFLRRMP